MSRVVADIMLFRESGGIYGNSIRVCVSCAVKVKEVGRAVQDERRFRHERREAIVKFGGVMRRGESE